VSNGPLFGREPGVIHEFVTHHVTVVDELPTIVVFVKQFTKRLVVCACAGHAATIATASAVKTFLSFDFTAF
jgi:hypothetical protein